MGTRADFYIGRGADAEWLGSIAWDGYPDGIKQSVLKCTTVAGFRRSVANFLKDRDDKSLPSDGWPWPWNNSNTTDFAYSFDSGKVHGSCFGSNWFDPLVEMDENDERQPSDDPPLAPTFPNMKDAKRRPMFGAHSGVILITAK